MKKVRGSNTRMKCKECGAKITIDDSLGSGDRKEAKKRIKAIFKQTINTMDILKMMINPNNDRKLTSLISESQYSLYRLMPVAVAALVDDFEHHNGGRYKDKKKKKNKHKGNGGIRFTGGGRSLGGFR